MWLERQAQESWEGEPSDIKQWNDMVRCILGGSLGVEDDWEERGRAKSPGERC